MSDNSICIFCGARSGTRAEWGSFAKDLGAKLGKDGWELIFGGGRWGLMGELAESVQKNGGAVTGIITENLLKVEPLLHNLDEVIVTQTLSERKARMISMANIVLVLPGGLGTLDEFFEVLTLNQLGIVKKSVVIVNIFNYFDNLLKFLDKAVLEGFMLEDHRSSLITCASLEQVLKELNAIRFPEKSS